jgi:hypothetical protein
LLHNNEQRKRNEKLEKAVRNHRDKQKERTVEGETGPPLSQRLDLQKEKYINARLPT